jgi:aerobic-type carbon monoxide dehydrogenase small subunit (CoxS/CutS family)
MNEDRLRITRRDMLRGAGAAALMGSLTSAGAQEAKTEPGVRRLGPGPVKVEFELNGKPTSVEVEPRVTLLDALRDHLGFTGSKRACDRGACGACTVWIDGKTANACMQLAVDAHGRSVRTIEGLAGADGTLHPLQAAFIKHDAFQCGFCTSGMLMSGAALLEREKRPSDEQIRAAVAGNLCRCGTYPHVFDACREAVR